MPPDDRDLSLLMDMADSAGAIAQMLAGFTLDRYAADRTTRRAVERELEIIGEAARAISDVLKGAHPEVPWAKIVATRHRLAHEYGDIQDAIVYRIATHHVPELRRLLQPLLPDDTEG